MGVPLVEDNPYGDLWFDTPPPAPLASHWPEGVLYLGSFSKVLTPGFRLGYLCLTALHACLGFPVIDGGQQLARAYAVSRFDQQRRNPS